MTTNRPIPRSSPGSRLARLTPGLMVALSIAPPGIAQIEPPADSFPLVRSMGLPVTLRPYAGIGAGFSAWGPRSGIASRAHLGVQRDIRNPVYGFLALMAEGWVGSHAGKLDGGARVMAGVPFAGLEAGVDYSVLLDRPHFALSLYRPLRRGGLFLPGDGIRFDWIPGRASLLASVALRLEPSMGRTRPRRITVQAPERPALRPVPAPVPPDPALGRALDRIRHSGLWLARTIVPLFPSGPPERAAAADSVLGRHLTLRDSAFPNGHGVTAEIEAFHDGMNRAFAAAIGLSRPDSSASRLARTVTDTARWVLLEEFLFPYDRNLGQLRPKAVIQALSERAAASFAAWLDRHPDLTGTERERSRAVFDVLLEVSLRAAEIALAGWKDSRLIWLPLQYGLRVDEYDTQPELDRIVERMIGREFAGGNDIVYATDERFAVSLTRSIVETRDYHVLWIHDIGGADPSGRPDQVTQEVALGGYFRALRAAAAAFDSTRRIPTFLIFLDRTYYASSRSDRWLRVLRDPLGATFTAPDAAKDTERRVRAAQDSLRVAIAGSRALQAEVKKRGSQWLRNMFAVHVSVTNPVDPSFRGPAAPGAVLADFPDDGMRDHRKIAFADLTERDPARGIAILTGLGVGEQYARYQWLDRTLVLRGPAALPLKAEARALLVSQGFREDEIPIVLRPTPIGADGLRPRSFRSPPAWSARAALAVNATGYGPKHVTVAKAVLYSLLPPGSLLIAADPQWIGRYWGGMLLGSSLRGARVMMIGPGPDNAPFKRGFVQLALQGDLFARLVDARRILEGALTESGGTVQMGLFKIGEGTYNVPAGVRAMRDGLRRYPFLRALLPFHQSVWDLFEAADSLIAAHGVTAPPDTTDSYHPKLHLKTQLFVNGATLREAIGRPEWRSFFARRINERLDEEPAGTYISLHSLRPLRPYLERRSPAARDRQISYLMVGSHNQDNRSFMLDGEASAIVAGADALVAAGDMLLISTVGVEWMNTSADVERNFPGTKGFKARLARAVEGIF